MIVINAEVNVRCVMVCEAEEDNFDKFVDKLKKCEVEYVHPLKEHSWGQRVVRIYDSDRHIIEVGENIKVVCTNSTEDNYT